MKFIFLALLCVCSVTFAGELPDPVLTPGAVRAVTAEELCTTSTKLVRHTSAAMKAEVYRRYGVTARYSPQCTGKGHVCDEVDHRAPLEDGGADVLENLWIQPYDGPWNAHMKDQLENLIHRRICAGEMSVEDAQRIFLGDWIEAYKQFFTNEGK